MPAVVSTFKSLETDIAIFVGGLDQKTPTLQLKPGRAIARYAINYECVATKGGGYARIGGYERFDGRSRPSAAAYSLIQVESFVNIPSAGQTLTGAASGATGTIIAVGSNYLALTQITGTFSSSEVVKVGGTTIGTATTVTVTLDAETNAQYLNLAADVYRALIGTVPGSGEVRGVVAAIFSGSLKVYAFRDNVGATACDLHEASASGWTVVPLFNEVSFTVGNGTEPADGATLTQGGVTATIKRSVSESGSWMGGTAAGRFIIDTPTGGNFAAGAATIGGTTCTLSGAETAITIPAGGKYEFVVKNFFGQLTTKRIYGVNTVGRAFEFDGTVFVPIATGAGTDTPSHVQVHQKHLFLSIGSSILHSGPGLPYRFNTTDGGGEIATGDDVTGMRSLPGASGSATMLVDCRNSKSILYGSAAGGPSPWDLIEFNNEVGGVAYSQQVLTDAYSLDDAGVQSLRAAAELSGFAPATLTQDMQDFIDEKRGLLAYSAVHKGKSQYRLYFTDGSALYLTIVNGKFIGALPQSFPNAFYTVWQCESSSGEERTFAGAASGGYVYELDRGSSFDGENIDAILTLAWNPSKSARVVKDYKRASIEMASSFFARLHFAYALGYGSSEYAQPGQQAYDSNFSGAPAWDAVNWDAFIWDGNTLSPTEADMEGQGENVQITLSSSTDYIQPYTLNSVILHFLLRRALR